MNSMRLITGFTLTLILPLLLLVTSNAQAFDLKTWSGSTCQAFYGAQEQYFDKTWSGIKNTSSVPRWISCGVTDDTYGSGGNYDNGTQGANVYITQAVSSVTTCYLTERGFTGQEIDTDTQVKSGTGYLGINTAASDSFYGSRLLACKLAPGAALNWFRIWEYDSSDGNH